MILGAVTKMAGLFDTIKNYYQQNVELPKRMYGESLAKGILGIQSPQTEANFNPEELGVLKQFLDNVYKNKMAYFSRPKKELLSEASQLESQAKQMQAAIDKEKVNNPNATYAMDTTLLTRAKQLRDAAEGKFPTDFKVDYNDFYNVKKAGSPAYPQTDINWRDTLGQFRFKVDDKGNYQVYDNYEFSNPSRQPNVDRYAAMNPLSRLYNSIKDFSSNTGSLGEAYLGNEGVPVNINIPKEQVVSPFYKDPFQ